MKHPLKRGGSYKKSPQSGEAGAKKAIPLDGWLFIDARKMPSLAYYNAATPRLVCCHTLFFSDGTINVNYPKHSIRKTIRFKRKME